MLFNNSFKEVFSSAPWFVVLILILLVITVLVHSIKGFRQWKFNQAQPVLTLAAEVISKNTDITRGIRTSMNASVNKNSTDSALYRYVQTVKYIVQFQVETGESKRFYVKRKEYERLDEKDYGKLTYQGTRYLGFVKTRQKGT